MDGVTNKFAFLKAPKLKFERLEHEDEMAMNRYEFALFVQHENRTVPFQGEGGEAEVREARRRKQRGSPAQAASCRNPQSWVCPGTQRTLWPLTLSHPRSPHHSASPWVLRGVGGGLGVGLSMGDQCLRLRVPVNYQLYFFGRLANRRAGASCLYVLLPPEQKKVTSVTLV